MYLLRLVIARDWASDAAAAHHRPRVARIRHVQRTATTVRTATAQRTTAVLTTAVLTTAVSIAARTTVPPIAHQDADDSSAPRLIGGVNQTLAGNVIRLAKCLSV